MPDFSRRGCSCLVAILGLIVLVVWFAIALNTKPIAPTKSGVEGVIQALVYAFVVTPRFIASVFGFKLS